jgi:predicted small secreted protein
MAHLWYACGMNLRRGAAVAAVVVACFTLSACGSAPGTDSSVGQASSGTEAGPLHWYNTEYGALQCLRAGADHGYSYSSCDWATLVPGKTVPGRTMIPGHLVDTKLGKVYCLTVPESYGHNQYDCDWQQVTAKLR